MVLSHSFTGDRFCRLSFYYMVNGVELVVTVTGVGVVWTSGAHDVKYPTLANFTFDLQEFGVLEERNVTLSLGEVWNGNGTVFIWSPTLYPCTQCSSPPHSEDVTCTHSSLMALYSMLRLMRHIPYGTKYWRELYLLFGLPRLADFNLAEC